MTTDHPHNGSQNDDDILTMEEVAAWLRVNKAWVKNHCTRYTPIIPHRRFGKKIRFRRAEVRAFLEEGKCTTPNWATTSP